MLALALTILFLVPASLACLYYFIHIVASCFPRRTPHPDGPTRRIAVLIPAHDEESGLAMTLRSLELLDYPIHLLRCLVVADNCTDRTAEIARLSGAECVERTDPQRRGKGYAVEFGLPFALAENPDAVLILDADCTVDPELLLRFDAELATGAGAVQAAVTSRNAGADGAGYVPAVGADMDNRLAAGSCRMGGSAALRGTGMLFRSSLLRRYPWEVNGLVEDAEYREVLRRAGVPIRFVFDRSVHCLPPPQSEAFLIQRRRWRSALFLRGRNPFARFVGSKPLVLGHLALTTGAVFLFAPETWSCLWLAALYLATGASYLPSLLRVGWPAGGARSFIQSFGLVGRLALLAVKGLWTREAHWTRTPRRPHESISPEVLKPQVPERRAARKAQGKNTAPF